jgi:hypothetical protein
MFKRISVLVITAAVVASAAAMAYEPVADAAVVQTAAQGGKPGMSGMPMQDMAKMHDKMMADMKADQAKLEELVAKMNAASGTSKVDVMASLLTAIVQNHGKAVEHMDMMHQHMMKMK